FFQAEDGIRDFHVTGVQTCALPILFQCVGEGGGVLEYFVCERPLEFFNGCVPDDAADCDYDSSGQWATGSAMAGPFSIPPLPPKTEPDSQACCESDATSQQTMDGCEDDCARAACKEALATLVQAKADASTNAPGVCGAGCVARTEDSLQFWIDYLEVNFDTCVEAA